MRVSIQHIVAGLGGEQLIKRSVNHEFDLMEVVKEGLPMESVAFLQHNFGFTNKQMSHLLAISESTYQRRIRAKSKLNQDETEKAISLAEVYRKGIDVYENAGHFSNWLNTIIPALNYQRPIDLLHSALGRRQIMDTLFRIEHGIYS